MITQNRYNRPIPDYYRTMYEDGYEPWEILASAHKKILVAGAGATQTPAPQEDYNVKITSEVKVKK